MLNKHKVKFIRGSNAAWERLKMIPEKIDNDTLYFIYDDIESSTDGQLFLGKKLISDNKIININDIGDIQINDENLSDQQILIYDEENQKWKNSSLEEIIDLSNYYTKDEVNNLLPTKTSDLINDNNFITNLYLNQYINEEILSILNKKPTIFKKGYQQPPYSFIDNKDNQKEKFSIGDIWFTNNKNYYLKDIKFNSSLNKYEYKWASYFNISFQENSPATNFQVGIINDEELGKYLPIRYAIDEIIIYGKKYNKKARCINYYNSQSNQNLFTISWQQYPEDKTFIIYKSNKMPPWILSNESSNYPSNDDYNNLKNNLPLQVGDIWIYQYQEKNEIYQLSNIQEMSIPSNWSSANKQIIFNWIKKNPKIDIYRGYYGQTFDNLWSESLYKDLTYLWYADGINITAVPRPKYLENDLILQAYYVEDSPFYLYFFYGDSSIEKIYYYDESNIQKYKFNIKGIRYFNLDLHNQTYQRRIAEKDPPAWVENNYQMLHYKLTYNNLLWINRNNNRAYAFLQANDSNIKEGKRFSWIPLTNKIFYFEEDPPQIKSQYSVYNIYSNTYSNNYIEISPFQKEDIYISSSGVYKCLSIKESVEPIIDENENLKIEYIYEWQKISNYCYTKDEVNNLLSNFYTKNEIDNKGYLTLETLPIYDGTVI